MTHFPGTDTGCLMRKLNWRQSFMKPEFKTLYHQMLSTFLTVMQVIAHARGLQRKRNGTELCVCVCVCVCVCSIIPSLPFLYICQKLNHLLQHSKKVDAFFIVWNSSNTTVTGSTKIKVILA